MAGTVFQLQMTPDPRVPVSGLAGLFLELPGHISISSTAACHYILRYIHNDHMSACLYILSALTFVSLVLLLFLAVLCSPATRSAHSRQQLQQQTTFESQHRTGEN